MRAPGIPRPFQFNKKIAGFCYTDRPIPEDTLKVVDLRMSCVTVPMEAPLRWSMGVETGTTRGIIQVFTDEGITGIGETYGGNSVEHAVELAKPYVVGLDP